MKTFVYCDYPSAILQLIIELTEKVVTVDNYTFKKRTKTWKDYMLRTERKRGSFQKFYSPKIKYALLSTKNK